MDPNEYLDRRHSLRLCIPGYKPTHACLDSDEVQRIKESEPTVVDVVKKLATCILQDPDCLFGEKLDVNVACSDFQRLCRYCIDATANSDGVVPTYVIDARKGNVRGGTVGDRIQRMTQNHFWCVRVRGKSLRDVLTQENIEKALWYNIRYKDTPYRSEIRRSLAFTTGGFGHINRFPAILARVVLTACHPTATRIFDPCGGWGGRLLGVLSWSPHTQYTCCEPCGSTAAGLNQTALILGLTNRCTIIAEPVEEVLHTKKDSLGMFDVVITSPPFFDLEQYSSEESQSTNRYPTWDRWTQEWFRPLIRDCLSVLKPDGLSAWAVGKYKTYPIIKNLVDYHAENGWVLTSLVVRRGSSRPGKHSGGSKQETVYCFRRRGVDT